MGTVLVSTGRDVEPSRRKLRTICWPDRQTVRTQDPARTGGRAGRGLTLVADDAPLLLSSWLRSTSSHEDHAERPGTCPVTRVTLAVTNVFLFGIVLAPLRR